MFISLCGVNVLIVFSESSFKATQTSASHSSRQFTFKDYLKMHQRHVDVKLLQELLLQAHFIFQTSDTFICIDSYAQGYN